VLSLTRGCGPAWFLPVGCTVEMGNLPAAAAHSNGGEAESNPVPARKTRPTHPLLQSLRLRESGGDVGRATLHSGSRAKGLGPADGGRAASQYVSSDAKLSSDALDKHHHRMWREVRWLADKLAASPSVTVTNEDLMRLVGVINGISSVEDGVQRAEAFARLGGLHAALDALARLKGRIADLSHRITAASGAASPSAAAAAAARRASADRETALNTASHVLLLLRETAYTLSMDGGRSGAWEVLTTDAALATIVSCMEFAFLAQPVSATLGE